MGHDVSDGTEQSLDLVPVNGRAGHVLKCKSVEEGGAEKSSISGHIICKKLSMYMYIIGRDAG